MPFFRAGPQFRAPSRGGSENDAILQIFLPAAVEHKETRIMNTKIYRLIICVLTFGFGASVPAWGQVMYNYPVIIVPPPAQNLVVPKPAPRAAIPEKPKPPPSAAPPQPDPTPTYHGRTLER